ncbi:hypothetical protein LPJ61_003180 [Coemansia biformis]|uniref:Small ribosomal subunit protein mS38 n=1 Tax=Coemansia biformis TaxID=1286918 RepID=A0A9W7YCN1_9FUNG|nr:hypothetical protein LPJ61_003180 [Coemansia biformis]
MGLVARLARLELGQRGVSTTAAEAGSGSGAPRKQCVRRYSVSGKRTPAPGAAAAPRQGQQQQQQEEGRRQQDVVPAICENSNRNRVPKFTMAQTEFLAADLFARHRQLVEVPESGRAAAMDAGSARRASFKTVSEILMCKGMDADEANMPHSKLKQIYAAPASVYMRVAPTAMIPEAMRLGPLAEPLLGKNTFSDGVGSLSVLRGEEEIEFVESFFDVLLHRARNPGESSSARKWSVRRERREGFLFRSRWEESQVVDPVDGINEYQMTSVRRKRKTKMNKHKHRKLRKKTRALRKRLGK